MLGAGTAGFATPFAFAYALHTHRRGRAPVLGRIALTLMILEVLACLALAALWSRNFLA